VWLGLAWFAGAPGLPAREAGRYVWARFVREGAADLLPFSQLGGVVIGARVAARARAGAAVALVWASLVIDLTTEMASQVVYTLGGVAGLGWRLTGGGRHAHGEQAAVLWGAGALLVAGAGLLVAFVVLQRRGVNLVGALVERVLPGAAGRADAVATALDGVWRRRDRVALATAMHGGGWVGNAAVSWLALQLMGVSLPFLAVLTLESLALAVKSFGFAIPGALGVQEGAYAVIGPVFGLPAETALALSFVKRARDLAVGAPVLLVWNAIEGRGLLRPRASCPPPPPAAA
jgi:putative membrane protein